MIYMFKKILIPVDGSEASWKALEYAKQLATKFSGDVVIVNVVQPYYSASLVAMPLDNVFAGQNDNALQNGEMILQIAKEKMADFPGDYECRLEKGHPSERILAVTRENACDAVVIGSRGLSGVAEFFLGSVSSKVSEHSKVPVVIVKG